MRNHSRRARRRGPAGLLARSLAGLVALACHSAEPTRTLAELGASPIPASRAVAFVGATVITMAEPRPLERQTLVVRSGIIVALGPEASTPVPDDATAIDARGRYLMPGLVDMHVHLRRADVPAYTAAGITTVRDMWGHDGVRAIARDVAAGTLRGPSIYAASPGVDGDPPARAAGVVISDPAAASALVDRLDAEGWAFLKVYQRLRRDVYDALLAAANARGMRVVGHVPTAVPLEHALASGQQSIEHLGGYGFALAAAGGNPLTSWIAVRADRIPALARETRDAGVWNCPTLVVVQRLAELNLDAPQAALVTEHRRAVVRALRDVGARLLLGTDAGIGVVDPGASLHAELSELVAAGLTPYEALGAGTHDAAEFLGALDRVGTVTVGKRADLLLLDGDPLRDVRNAATPAGVMLRGEWLPREYLAAMTRDAVAR